jgi:plasmid stability protein
MAQLVVRNLDEELKHRLKEQARRHGRSTEEEVREILRGAVMAEGPPRPPLGTRLGNRFRGIGLTAPIEELRGGPAQPAELG